MKLATLVLFCAFGATSCSIALSATEMPDSHAAEINGTTLDVMDIGKGTPIVFVHGAIADLRVWADYVAPISTSHRFIAYTRRHYGVRPWPENAVDDDDVHSEDLIALIEALDLGPVHLVSWSNAASPVTYAAVKRPDLVRSIVHYEPVVSSVLMDGARQPDVYAVAADDWGSRWGKVVDQLDAGDKRHALRKMVELVFELPPGGFASLEPNNQAIHLDNARTIPLLFNATKTTPTTCDYVAKVETSTLVLLGVETHKAWSMEAERLVECMPNATLALIAGVNHQGPVTAPKTIAHSILSFVDTID